MQIKTHSPRMVTWVVLAGFAVPFYAVLSERASAQNKSNTPTTQPDLKDDRLAFLTVQLSSIEESIKAVDLAIKRTGYKVQINQEKVKLYEKGNELMDRQGGGPMPWDQFYGRTADKFFYHPTDSNTKYRFGNKNADAKAPVPAPQRPSQLDYFYRANKTQAEQAAAEVAALGTNIDRLLQRRRQLELEQSAMWATITTEAVRDTNIPLRPLYRFRLHSTATVPANAAQNQRLAVVRAFALFIRKIDQDANQIHENVRRSQTSAYMDSTKNIEAAHQQLQRDVLAQAIASDPPDGKQIAGLLTQAKRLRNLSTNASDAFSIQTAADDAGDEPRHRTARGQLQESVLSSAEVVLVMHQDLTKLAAGWGIEGEQGEESPDPLPAVPAGPPMAPEYESNGHTAPVSPTNHDNSIPAVPKIVADKPSRASKAIDLLPQLDLRSDVVTGKWEVGKEGLTCVNGGGKLRLPYTPGQEYDFHIEFTRVSGEGDVVQQLSQGDHRFGWLMGYWKNTAFGFGRVGGKSANQNKTTVQVNPALTNGKRYSCVVQVRRASIAAWIDGKQVARLETDFSNLSEQPAWVIDGPLGIGCNSPTVFHVVEVIPNTKEGKLTRATTGQ